MAQDDVGILKCKVNGITCYLADIDDGLLYVNNDIDGALKFTRDEAQYFKGFEFVQIGK